MPKPQGMIKPLLRSLCVSYKVCHLQVRCDGIFGSCSNCRELRFLCSFSAIDIDCRREPDSTGQLDKLELDRYTRLERCRARRACEQCHRLKVRCSGGSPCSRCEQCGVSCAYPPSARGTASNYPDTQPLAKDATNATHSSTALPVSLG